MRILLAEDDGRLAEPLQEFLAREQHAVCWMCDGRLALAELLENTYDLALLDWMLPGQSGTTLCRHWRTQQRTRDLPVVMLTARADEADQVYGLEAGADDYITKPLSPKSLVARIRAVLRRRAPQALEDRVQVGDLHLDPSTRRVSRSGPPGAEEVKVGPTEFRLLHFLMRHPERVHSRAQLLDRVWGDHVFIEERTVDVHVKRLREALSSVDCSGMVETVRGVGYRLTASVSRAAA